MLNALRRGAGSLPAKIFFGVLVASFAVWGIGDVFTGGGQSDTVAEIGDIQITSQEFTDNYRRNLNLWEKMLDINAEQAQGIGLHLQLLDALIAQRLYDLHADEFGISISDQALRDEVHSRSAFRNEAGKFDRTRFEAALLSDGRTESGYFEELRKEISRKQVIESLLPGVPPPTTLTKSLYRWRGERRVAKLTKIKIAPKSIRSPNQGELDNYHKSNSETFTLPELRTISYVHLTPSVFADEIIISENKLIEEYEVRAVDLESPERRTIFQLSLEDEVVARQAATRILNGETFFNIATELGRGKDTALGTVTKLELPAEFADIAFEIGLGETSTPIKSPFGWHLLFVTEIMPSSIPTFDQLRDELKQTIKNESAIDIMYSIIDQLEDSLGGGATLEDAASSLGIPLSRIDGVDSKGRDINGKIIQKFPGGIEVVEKAFNLQIGEESMLTETEEGGYIVMRIDGIMPPRLRPLADIRDKVTNTWKKDKAQEKAVQLGKELVDILKLGKTLGKDPVGRALKVETSNPFMRDGVIDGSPLPLGLIGDLFETTLGGVATSEIDGGVVVAQLSEILPAKSINQTQQNEITFKIHAEYSKDLLEQLRSALQNRYGVTVNQPAFNAIF